MATKNLNDQALNTGRVQTLFRGIRFDGLLPNTTYTITVDGEDYSNLTRQFGKDFGAALVSDENGSLVVGILSEIPLARDRNFELPRTNTLQFQNEQVSSTSRRTTQTVTNIIVVELTNSNGSSKAQFLINRTLLLRTGPLATLFPIE